MNYYTPFYPTNCNQYIWNHYIRHVIHNYHLIFLHWQSLSPTIIIHISKKYYIRYLSNNSQSLWSYDPIMTHIVIIIYISFFYQWLSPAMFIPSHPDRKKSTLMIVLKQTNNYRMLLSYNHYTGWCNNHLEKYEFVHGKDDIPYIMDSSKPPTSNHKWHKWFMRFTKLESCWNLIYKALITISIPFFPAIFIPSPERCHGATWLEGCSSNFRGSGAEARRARNSARKPNMESLRRWEHLGTIHGKSWEMMENHGKIMENDGKSWEMMGKWWENDENMMGKSWEIHQKMAWTPL